MRLCTLLPTAAFLLLAVPMKATNYTYTYTGNPFTSVQSPFTTSDSISGSVVLSGPVPANLGTTGSPVPYSSIPLTLVSYSFTDGVDTISNTSPDPGSPILTLTTDSTGKIIAWTFDFSLFSGPDIFSNHTDHGFGFSSNDGAFDSAFDSASATSGAWALTSGGAAVSPEPSSLLLLGTGLLAAGALIRRRARRA